MVNVACPAHASYYHVVDKKKSECWYGPEVSRGLPIDRLTEPLRTSARITNEALVYLHRLTVNRLTVRHAAARYLPTSRDSS